MEVKKLKRIGVIILVLALLLFIFTNTESAPITVIYRDFEVPLILVMLMPLLFGFALGMYVARNIGREKPKKKSGKGKQNKPETKAEEAAPQ